MQNLRRSWLGIVRIRHRAPMTPLVLSSLQCNARGRIAPNSKRYASSESSENKKSDLTKFDADEYDDYTEPQTSGGWVRLYAINASYLLLLVGAAACIYVTIQNLFGQMSPDSMRDKSFEKLQALDEVRALTGESMTISAKTRQRHVFSREYVAEDGSKRTRIRYLLQGPRGRALVWAEMSENLKDEFVYLIVQSLENGRVVTVVDNRMKLDAQEVSAKDDVMSKISSLLSRN